MTETAIIIITTAQMMIPLIYAVVNPFPFQKLATADALNRDWNMSAIIITRCIPYLTMYSQCLTLVALYYKTPITMLVAQSTSWFVFVLYHGLNYMDPMNLAYHPKELVNQVIRWTPPSEKTFKNVVTWLGLHFQHTVFPFYLHYVTHKYKIVYRNNYDALGYNSLFIVTYMFWFLICWKVQGVAAYPIMNRLREHDAEFTFYLMCFGLSSTISSVLISM